MGGTSTTREERTDELQIDVEAGPEGLPMGRRLQTRRPGLARSDETQASPRRVVVAAATEEQLAAEGFIAAVWDR